jgi:CO/xanthine dehydrogenase Mo-binding subunit
LSLPAAKVRVCRVAVGGAFGGREDITLQIHLALAAWTTRRPVKMVYSRPESMCAHVKRHAYTVRRLVAASQDGRLLGVRAQIIGNTGAYASTGGEVLKFSMAHVVGPYEVDSVHADGYVVYTNNIPGGAMRGFGVPQMAFVHESQMDQLARLLKMDPVELRLKNLLQDGSVLPTGNVLPSAQGLHRAVEAALGAARWRSENR